MILYDEGNAINFTVVLVPCFLIIQLFVALNCLPKKTTFNAECITLQAFCHCDYKLITDIFAMKIKPFPRHKYLNHLTYHSTIM